FVLERNSLLQKTLRFAGIDFLASAHQPQGSDHALPGIQDFGAFTFRSNPLADIELWFDCRHHLVADFGLRRERAANLCIVLFGPDVLVPIARPLYAKHDAREATTSPPTFERAVISSSVMPSANGSCRQSPVIFANGRTAIRGPSSSVGPTLRPCSSVCAAAALDAL